MQRKKILLPIVLFGFVFSLMVFLHAESGSKTFSGNFMFGYRTVDTSGAHFKYKEDFNLDEGIRLFNFSLSYTPEDKFKKLFDRVDIYAYNFGGDPFETFGLSIQKYGKYKFQYDRKKSEYFYHDLQEVGPEVLYDSHTFNFDRMIDSGSLKIMFGKNVDFFLNFESQSKKGSSTTTLDINRIEFEFDKPINENSKEGAVGVDVHFKRYSFVFEEKLQDYKNSNSFFLPGFADGGPGASYPSSFNYLNSNQPYSFKTYTHTFKFNARPFDSFIIAGSARLSNQKMDLTFSEDAEGINYIGNSFLYGLSGSGHFDRKMRLFDLDATYLLFNKLAVIGAVRYNDFEQEGHLTVNSIREDVSLKFDALGFEGGLQYQLSPKIALTVGYRNEARNLEGIETATYEYKTKRTGLFGNLKWDILQTVKLTADYQHGDYLDPFTLISPIDFGRFRATAKLKLNQFSVSGSYLWNRSKSKIYDDLWNSSKNQLNLRFGYRVEKFKVATGYALINVKHEGDRTVTYPPSWSGPEGTFLWEIMYEGKSTLIDGSLNFNLNENLKIGGYGNCYSNKGFWEISRTMLKAYLEYTFNNGLLTQLGYRYINFKEKESGKNDYKANIFEISFGYRWK